MPWFSQHVQSTRSVQLPHVGCVAIVMWQQGLVSFVRTNMLVSNSNPDLGCLFSLEYVHILNVVHNNFVLYPYMRVPCLLDAQQQIMPSLYRHAHQSTVKLPRMEHIQSGLCGVRQVFHRMQKTGSAAIGQPTGLQQRVPLVCQQYQRPYKVTLYPVATSNCLCPHWYPH